MPTVLVHGVPETPAVWDPLRQRLSRDDVVAVQLPGFGGPRPEGFEATKEAYVSWLVDQLGLEMAGWVDQTMAGCVLDLYRSAVEVGREWSGDFKAIPAPGLVLIASDDPFLDRDGARSGAERAGATVTELTGLGHWWMLQDPRRAAAVLEEFWESL